MSRRMHTRNDDKTREKMCGSEGMDQPVDGPHRRRMRDADFARTRLETEKETGRHGFARFEPIIQVRCLAQQGFGQQQNVGARRGRGSLQNLRCKGFS